MNAKLKQPHPEEFYKLTQARLEAIKSQFTSTPRGFKLKGKVCVITGAGSLQGIGRATAFLYAREGAQHLYLLDYIDKNLPGLREILSSLYPDVKVTTLQADAADEEAIAGVCKKALEEEGRLDVFFANAGFASQSLLHDITSKLFMESMRVNALSVFLAIKHASAAMVETNASRGKPHSGGSIILTASVAGIRSGAGSVDYSASKAAVNSMAKTSAFQLQKTNIRVNSICPGLIETGMTSHGFAAARQKGTITKLGQLNPLGRYGIAEEIAQLALFLASDDSSYVNAQNIAIDGGLSGSHPVVPGKIA